MRINMKLYCIILINIIVITIIEASSIKEQINIMISELKVGKIVQVPFEGEILEKADEFLNEVLSIKDEEIRGNIIRFVDAIERANIHKKNKLRSQNIKFLEKLLRILELDTSKSVRKNISEIIMHLYSPNFLKSYNKSILNSFKKWKQVEILYVYCSFALINLDQVKKMIHKLKINNRTYYIDSMLARYGDKKAFQKLINVSNNLKQTSYFKSKAIFSAISYVDTFEMKVHLAKNLRNEDILNDASGGTSPKMMRFVDTLVDMMKDDPGFPVKRRNSYYSDDQLDAIETWCTQNLKIEFPKTPRKKIHSTLGGYTIIKE